jgi:hypothetical protein
MTFLSCVVHKNFHIVTKVHFLLSQHNSTAFLAFLQVLRVFNTRAFSHLHVRRRLVYCVALRLVVLVSDQADTSFGFKRIRAIYACFLVLARAGIP